MCIPWESKDNRINRARRQRGGWEISGTLLPDHSWVTSISGVAAKQPNRDWAHKTRGPSTWSPLLYCSQNHDELTMWNWEIWTGARSHRFWLRTQACQQPAPMTMDLHTCLVPTKPVLESSLHCLISLPREWARSRALGERRSNFVTRITTRRGHLRTKRLSKKA